MAKKSKFFEEVDPKVDFPKEEKKLLKKWEKTGLIKKYLNKNKNSKKYYSFLDGPITANNPMGVHHAWGRTYKDLWQRYKNALGYKQRFQNGFDAQGLWVEVEVEKELGFKNKKDIEDFGIAKFVALCKKRVKKYSDIQAEQSKRLGYFMDWDNSYYTLSDTNNYAIWHFLKVCYESGWLYKGQDSVPWCPRCETAISQHEMLTEDYKEITHESIYLSFPIVGKENEYLLVWTTTPWTIPANIAVAVDEKLDYSKVQVSKNIYWVAKETVKRVFEGEKYKILKNSKGAKLVGIRYEGAFDSLPQVKKVSRNDKFHSIIATDNQIMPITTTEGTGLVHTAVSAGTEDFRLGQKLDLPMIPVIEDDATYMENLGFLTGKNAKKQPEIIFNYLKKLKDQGKEYFFKIEKYKHRYPACWRCKTELVWKVTDEWYIAMDKHPILKSAGQLQNQTIDKRTLRQRMIDVAKKINWYPEFGLDRELDWLNNMHDWLISKKNRYWGLTLPIWECKSCANVEVVGSQKELKERAVEGWKDFEGKSPHKPQIDKIKIKCSNCDTLIERIEPVGNPWLDAGIVTYSTISNNNKSCLFQNSKEQPLYFEDKAEWQKWAPADFITESFPGQFKNWFYSLIAMSTVLENKEPTKNILGFATLLAEDGRAMHKSWGNAISFDEGADEIGADVMRWMYCRQNPNDNMLFGPKLASETRRKFHLKLWNIYNYFITYANLDGWTPPKRITKKSAKGRLQILDKWIKIRLNQTILSVSKNLENYDAYKASQAIEEFVDDFSLWYIRRSRERVGPIADSAADKKNFYNTCYFCLVELTKTLSPFNPFISELIYSNLTKKDSVHLEDWPQVNSNAVSEKDIELVDDMKKVREVVEKAHAIRKTEAIPVRQPLNLLKVNTLSPINNLDLLVKEELNVKKVDWNKSPKGDLSVKLDTKLTESLKTEAKMRELIRKIQSERKKIGLNLTQKVEVSNDWLPEEKEHLNYITKKAQVSKIEKGNFEVKKV
jgi:isoleucyl-tRNA synthetase